MLVDAETMAIRYLIIDIRNWWLGHLVLVEPQWIKEVSWVNSKIYINMSQQQVKSAPLFDSIITFNREHEKALHSHYGRDGYWEHKTLKHSVNHPETNFF